MKTFTYNRGLAARDPNECLVFEPDITLEKVTHIDLDSVLSVLDGMEPNDISPFMSPAVGGFEYLRSLENVVKAYAQGQLYVMSGNF